VAVISCAISAEGGEIAPPFILGVFPTKNN